MKAPQYWTVVLLLLSAFVLIHLRGTSDRVPSAISLDRLPLSIDHLEATDLPISQDALEILGNGIFLNRIYRPPSASPLPHADAPQNRSSVPDTAAPHPASSNGANGPVQGAPVLLFIGYFPTQRSGQSIHSPQNCLPGSGWTFEAKDRTYIRGYNGSNIRVGDYLVTDGTHRDEVLYWYFSHGHADANEYMAKWHLIRDSILLRRTDAALVRVVTPVAAGEDRETARRRVVEFADSLNSILSPYVPE